MARARLTPDQKVAAILLSIEQDLAAEILKNMGEDHVETIARAMNELQDLPVDQTTLQEIQKEALDRLRRRNGMAFGSVKPAMSSVLMRALGEQKGKALLEKAESGGVELQPGAAFDTLSPAEIASLLAEEHPQIAAVFLAHLGAEKSGKVLIAMPEARRADIVRRIATLDRTPSDLVQRVLEVMRNKVKSLGMGSGKFEPRAWVRVAAEILNNIDGASQKTLIDSLNQVDQKLAESLRDEMFTFDDLAKLDKRSMQKIISSVDTRSLAMSLKACEPATEENVMKNLSKRAREMILEEKESFGPLPLTDVLNAQREIIKTVRQLAESGDVKLGTSQEQMV